MSRILNIIFKINKQLKFKLNLIAILSLIFIFVFIYYGGESYINTLILGNKGENIVAINIKNPFITNSKEIKEKIVLLI